MTKKLLLICMMSALCTTPLYAGEIQARLDQGLKHVANAALYIHDVKTVTFELNQKVVNSCVNRCKDVTEFASDCYYYCADFFVDPEGAEGFEPTYQYNYNITLKLTNGSKSTFENCTIKNDPYNWNITISTDCKEKGKTTALEYYLPSSSQHKFRLEYYEDDEPFMGL